MKTTPRDPSQCLSHSRLKELLSYSPETGEFRWIQTATRRVPAGSIAGTKKISGKPISIRIDGKHYQAHQLAWFYVHGVWACSEIDHKNGDSSCNAINNLRPVTRNGNMQNERKARRTNKRSGLLGAYRGARGRWFSSICVDNKPQYLGTFDTPELAHEAYLTAKRALHQTCTI